MQMYYNYISIYYTQVGGVWSAGRINKVSASPAT